MAPSTQSRPEVILGGGLFGGPKISTSSDVQAWADVFRAHGHTRIDTAIGYPVENPGQSERLVAESGALTWCVIDTKVASFDPEAHTRNRLLASIEQSIKNLGFGTGQSQVDVMYLHAPCLTVPLEETVAAMDEARKRGYFKRFGISNYTPKHVEEMCQIAQKNGYALPAVYQGQYNPIGRKGEDSLFPVLRKYGIAFYAYTPTGAGIFSGQVSADSVNNPGGRWSHSTFIGKFSSAAYLRPELLQAADKVHSKAMEHGFNGHEAALRWVLWHSTLNAECGDGMIVGASSREQLEDNLKACDNGPLPEDVVRVIDDIWALAGPVAPWAYFETDSTDVKEGLKSLNQDKA